MRFHFKTSYDHDIRLFADTHRALRYAALLALAVALPFLVDDFLIGEATNVLIWAIAGMGLMLLTGHAGQPSLGHAAFLAAGCYANAILMDRFDLPFLASFTLAGILTGLAGVRHDEPPPPLQAPTDLFAIATLASRSCRGHHLWPNRGPEAWRADRPTITIAGRKSPYFSPDLSTACPPSRRSSRSATATSARALGRAFAAVRDPKCGGAMA